MIFKLVTYLRGYVCFIAEGGFVERFINLCAVRRINIWDVACFGNTLRAKTGIKDFKRLRSVARNTGSKIKIISRHGVPFYLRRKRSRVGLLIGVGIFVFFCSFMSNFVWCVSTHSTDKISRQQILAAAENAGLHYGTRVKSFDEEKAAREIYKALDGKLSWVKVNMKGSLAVIEYRESAEKLVKDEKGEPSNIVADFDGVIIADETYQGVKNKSRGDAVRKGEVLISGVVEGVDMKPLYYSAKGKFSALHNRTLEYSIDSEQEFFCEVVSERKNSLLIFGKEFPLSLPAYSAEKVQKYSYESYAEFDGYILPFGIIKRIEVNNKKASLTQKQKVLLTAVLYSSLEYESFANSNIVSSKINYSDIDTSGRITGEYNCIDFIGENKVIYLENN